MKHEIKKQRMIVQVLAQISEGGESTVINVSLFKRNQVVWQSQKIIV